MKLPRRDFLEKEKGISGRVAFRQKPKQAAGLGRHSRPRFAQSETEENLLQLSYMTETLNRPEHPEHFSEVHHENGEALMCMSSGGECRVLVEVMPGYSPEEEQQLIDSTTGALQAIDQYTGGKAADIFTGLHIKIGEDVAEGGAKAVAKENAVLLNGRKMLLSVAEMRQVSGAYSDEELAGFPDEQRPGGALEYTLVHEIGHVLDGQTKTGEAYHRVAASESPTKYGRETDEWHADNKDHEAFAEGFAHAVYGMPISETMEATVRETIDARLQEITESQANATETAGADQLETLQFNQDTRAFEQMRAKLGAEGMALLQRQLATLAELSNRPLESPLKNALESGDTTLPEGTLLHGMGMYGFSADAVKSVAEKGIVSGELVGISEDSETHGCADFFRVPEEMTVSQYFAWAREPVVSGNIRRQRGERLLTRGVAFIVDSQAEGVDKLLENDGYQNGAVADFVRPPSGRTAEDTAAILGGVPRGAIAGIVVDSRLLEKPEVTSALSQHFSDLPVFDHEGKRQILTADVA